MAAASRLQMGDSEQLSLHEPRSSVGAHWSEISAHADRSGNRSGEGLLSVPGRWRVVGQFQRMALLGEQVCRQRVCVDQGKRYRFGKMAGGRRPGQARRVWMFVFGGG